MALAVQPPNHTDESPLSSNGDPEKAKIVLRELERILSSRFFKNAERSRQFLEYVVRHLLDGHTERLKERTIGAELFHRKPGYATGDDPVVRVQAGEVRRRLEQHYQETPNGATVHIELPIGSYVPRLVWINGEDPAVDGKTQEQSQPVPKARPRWIKPAVVLGFIAVVAAAAVLATVNLRRSSLPQTELDQFWQPIFATQQPVLICLAKGVTYRPGPKLYERYARNHPGAFQTEVERSSTPLPLDPKEKLTWGELNFYDGYGEADGDVTAAVRLSALLGKLGKPNQLRIGSNYSFVDLRNSPAVVIGAFNNKWTLDLASNLHFAFVEENRQFKIKEQVRNGREWVVPQFGTNNPRDRDFAIVARLIDSKTGQFTVVAAGIEDRGTEAAGEFVSNPELMEKGLRNAPQDWRNKNIELVLQTKITDLTAGPPEVVAAFYW